MKPVEAGQVMRPRLGKPAVPEITHQIYYMSLDGAMVKQVKPPIKCVGTDVLQLRSGTKQTELNRCELLSQALFKFKQHLLIRILRKVQNDLSKIFYFHIAFWMGFSGKRREYL